MNNETTQYVCEYNLRPRVNGTAVLIEKGSPFKKEVVDSHTFDALLSTGEIKMYEEVVQDAEIIEELPACPAEDVPVVDELADLKAKALEEFGVKLPQRKLETAQAAYEDLAKKAANAPQGIFNLDIETLADKNLDELDSIHADICAEHGLPAPDAFETLEIAIDKLTSEA